MNTATAAPQASTASRPGVKPNRAADIPKIQSATGARPEAALTKKMPDYVHPNIKQCRIVAHVNVGWGNALFLRGEGGGLSWEFGVPMVCVGEDQWEWHFPAEEAPREIKFLRNDTEWDAGENHLVSSNEAMVFKPQFA